MLKITVVLSLNLPNIWNEKAHHDRDEEQILKINIKK